MPLVSEDPTNPTNLGDASPLEGSPVTRLKALEEELEDDQEQTRVALGRHTRGAEKDDIRRRFERRGAFVASGYRGHQSLNTGELD